VNDIIVYSPNPRDVEYRLRQADWRYANSATRGDDWVYNNFAVIPELFKYVATQKEIPSLEDCARYLWQYKNNSYITENAEPGKGQNALVCVARARTKKLVMDFYRELHTYGLLSHHMAFGNVRYAKGEDIYRNVDFTAMPSLVMAEVILVRQPIGIQSAMRSKWDDDQFSKLKAKRKLSQNRSEDYWDGPLYWLTNKNNPNVTKAGGCWLFTEQHISELIEQMKPQNEANIAINSEIV